MSVHRDSSASAIFRFNQLKLKTVNVQDPESLVLSSDIAYFCTPPLKWAFWPQKMTSLKGICNIFLLSEVPPKYRYSALRRTSKRNKTKIMHCFLIIQGKVAIVVFGFHVHNFCAKCPSIIAVLYSFRI